MNHFLFSAVLDCFITLSAALFFLFSKSEIKRYFSFFWLCVSYWTFLVGFQFYVQQWISPKMWGFLLHVGCISVPIVFYHFTLKYTGLSLSSFHKKILYAGYFLFALFLLLILVSNIFTGEVIFRPEYTYPKPSLLYPVYITYFQFYGFLSTLLLIKTRKGTHPEKRKFLDLFLLVYILAYIGAMDNYLIMYELRIFPLYPYGLYLIIPYAVFGSRSLIKLVKS